MSDQKACILDLVFVCHFGLAAGFNPGPALDEKLNGPCYTTDLFSFIGTRVL